MESFFRAVRNEFELNQHFEEDLLDQVRLMGCRVSVCKVQHIPRFSHNLLTKILRESAKFLSGSVKFTNLNDRNSLTAMGGRRLDLGRGQKMSQDGPR